jgi:hypothetical protein
MDVRSRCDFAVLEWWLTIPALREKEGRAEDARPSGQSGQIRSAQSDRSQSSPGSCDGRCRRPHVDMLAQTGPRAESP